MDAPILELKNINHSFNVGAGKKIKVLKDINLSLYPGEVIALLGPSGSGKSTTLRIMGGLLQPTHGKVLVNGKKLEGINQLISMVFQSFVLLPWLSVFDNVAVGLESLSLPEEEVNPRVMRAIELVGLAGFEEAYPKELSGGMKQRVGVARALVMERPILFLDEPFSALDVLTAETLRKEVLNLWLSKKTSTSSVVLVTHNITEAVSLGKRILVMGTNPGHIRVSIKNDLPYPRDEKSSGFQGLVDNIHDVITEAINPDTPDWVPPALAGSGIETLPPVSINEIIGLLEFVSAQGGRVDSFSMAQTLKKDFGQILFLAKAAELLELVDTPRHSIVLTEQGKRFVQADVTARKKMVHSALLELKLCQAFYQRLQNSPNFILSYDTALEFVLELLPGEDNQRLLDTLIQWGRYGELFGFNPDAKEVYLDVGQENA